MIGIEELKQLVDIKKLLTDRQIVAVKYEKKGYHLNLSLILDGGDIFTFCNVNRLDYTKAEDVEESDTEEYLKVDTIG